MKISRWSIIKFLKRYRERKSLENALRSGRPAADVSVEMMDFLDAEMERNDKMTAPELTRRVNDRFSQANIKCL